MNAENLVFRTARIYYNHVQISYSFIYQPYVGVCGPVSEQWISVTESWGLPSATSIYCCLERWLRNNNKYMYLANTAGKFIQVNFPLHVQQDAGDISGSLWVNNIRKFTYTHTIRQDMSSVLQSCWFVSKFLCKQLNGLTFTFPICAHCWFKGHALLWFPISTNAILYHVLWPFSSYNTGKEVYTDQQNFEASSKHW